MTSLKGGSSSLAQSAAAEPLEYLVLGDKRYRVGTLTRKQRIECQMLGAAIGRQELLGKALTIGVGITALALISEHHPELTLADVVPFMRDALVQPIGQEVARQLINRARLSIN